MTYDEASLLPRSEKITLVIMRAIEQVKIFTLFSGSVYVRDVLHFVESVKDGSSDLLNASSSSLSAGQFFFDAVQKKLYVRMSDSSNPKTRDVSLTYKFFYSNAPIKLPSEIYTGVDIDFEPLVTSIGSIGQQLDEESTGIVLESSSSVAMINEHGYFDEIYDTLIWENQSVEFYSYISGIDLSETRKIFEGVVESKDFSTSQVSFKVKDFVFKLKNFLKLGRFSSLDGDIDPSMIDKPKRRVYGQVKQLKCTGLNKVLSGYPLASSISGLIDTNQITGTNFLADLSVGDELVVTINNIDYKLSIDSIESDTSATLGSELDLTLVNQGGFIVKPQIGKTFRNRNWSVAGHKLRAPSAEITSIIRDNRFLVDTTEDFFADDQVEINGDLVTIRRVSGNEIVLDNAVSPLPFIGDIINKLPIQKVFAGKEEYIYLRDWTFQNATEAKIIFNEDAEFNVAREKTLGVNLVFTNGSRSLTTSSVVDFRSILKPNDFIRSKNILEPDYYEILQVKEQEIILRSPFLGVSGTKSATYKNIDAITDETIVTCNCLGIEVDGLWLKTASDAVRHLIINDAEFTNVNEDSFSKAKANCDYILSLPIPLNEGDSSPLIRDVITLINESVFGSLYGNSSFSISYGVLNSVKPPDNSVIKDDDILSFDSSSTQRIINSIKINYRPFIDIFSGNEAFESYTKTSDFVNNLIGIKNSREETVYLYEEDKAEIMGQRILFFNSMSATTVTVKAKMNFASTSVNDKIFLSLDRLYKRYGGADKRKIGVVTGVKKNGFDTEVTFTDLGNVYNRVPSIAPNGTVDYSGQIADDLIRWGYIVDNEVLTPDASSEVGRGNNLIG